VLDLAKLLTCKIGNVNEMACYCKYGGASYVVKEVDEWKKGFACDMVLCCIPCYKERLDESGHEESNKGQRSHRSRK
jgi:hypothetical protein